MGCAKAWLPFGPETLLERTVRTLQSVVPLVIVVAAPRQRLPQLPPLTLLAVDRYPDRGPLQGLRDGLEMAASHGCQRAFVCSTDLPFLQAKLVQRLLQLSEEAAATVPWVDGTYHPLTAAYCTSITPVIDRLLASGQRRPRSLFEHVRTRFVDEATLREVDPELRSLQNINTPEEYATALRIWLSETRRSVHPTGL
jgi:molybdopterin-guanine dinucleotide biosynthesis protein A